GTTTDPLFPEVFPALRLQFLLEPIFVSHPYLPPAPYGAKVADINSRDPGWHLLPNRCGKQQFVIFSAVQGKPKISLSGHRNFVGFDLGTHTALFANVAQVGGKPIADID